MLIKKQQQALFFYSPVLGPIAFLWVFRDCGQTPDQTFGRFGCGREVLYAETSCFRAQRRLYVCLV